MKKKTAWYIASIITIILWINGLTNKENWKDPQAFIGVTIILIALAVFFAWRGKKTDPEARFKSIPKDQTKQDIKTLKKLRDYTVIDIETTGFSTTDDEIIELGAVRVRNSKIVKTFSTLINPKRALSPKITELTGITYDMLTGAPTLNEVTPQFKAFIGNDTIIGHNIIRFDSQFINQAFLKTHQGLFNNALIDTLPLAQAMYPDWPRHRLLDLIRNLQIADTENHRALDDATQTMQVFEIMKQQLR